MYAVASVSPTMAVVRTAPVARLGRNEDMARTLPVVVIGSTPRVATVESMSAVSPHRIRGGSDRRGTSGRDIRAGPSRPYDVASRGHRSDRAFTRHGVSSPRP